MSAAPPDDAGRRERRARLAAGTRALGLALPADASDRLLAFLDLLDRWNRAYNLTAVRDPDAMLVRHLLDSLAVAPYLFGDRVLDLGTGPGLPGLPLAVAEPTRRFWLLDGSGKKIRFVRQAVSELGLANIEPVLARIEAYRPGRKFSTIVARAVASAATIRDLTGPFLASPGRLLVMKGRVPHDELAQLTHSSRPGEAGIALHPLRVPFLEGERHLIEIRRD